MELVSHGTQMVGKISQDMVISLELEEDTIIVGGGTADSNAAFFAAAGTKPLFGMVVTSLRSMLAMKHLSQTYVEDADRKGVYSHHFPNFVYPNNEAWLLVGGASNFGCTIL